MNTSLVVVQNIRKNSLQDTQDTSTRTAMPDTMTWEKISLLSDAGRMPGESLTKQ